MKLRYGLAVIGVVGVMGAVAIPMDNVQAEINNKIELLGEEFQIAISPAYVEFSLIPGTVTSEKIRVRNVGSLETDLKIGVAPLDFSDETTAIGVPRNEIVGWTTVELEDTCEATKVENGAIFVHMRVKEECFVRFSTATPANAAFGEQYMNVYFQEYREDSEGSVQMIRSIGANVYGTNSTGASHGEGDICGKVISQSVPFWLFEGPLRTNVKIENCGRLNFHATIEIEVYNLFGGLMYKDVGPQDRIVAAESTRTIEDNWGDATIGIFRTKQTVVTLGETYEIEKWTFIIPIWLIVLFLVCIIVIVLAIIYGRKKKNLKKVKK